MGKLHLNKKQLEAQIVICVKLCARICVHICMCAVAIETPDPCDMGVSREGLEELSQGELGLPLGLNRVEHHPELHPHLDHVDLLALLVHQVLQPHLRGRDREIEIQGDTETVRETGRERKMERRKRRSDREGQKETSSRGAVERNRRAARARERESVSV